MLRSATAGSSTLDYRRRVTSEHKRPLHFHPLMQASVHGPANETRWSSVIRGSDDQEPARLAFPLSDRSAFVRRAMVDRTIQTLNRRGNTLGRVVAGPRLRAMLAGVCGTLDGLVDNWVEMGQGVDGPSP